MLFQVQAKTVNDHSKSRKKIQIKFKMDYPGKDFSNNQLMEKVYEKMKQLKHLPNDFDYTVKVVKQQKNA